MTVCCALAGKAGGAASLLPSLFCVPFWGNAKKEQTTIRKNAREQRDLKKLLNVKSEMLKQVQQDRLEKVQNSRQVVVQEGKQTGLKKL